MITEEAPRLVHVVSSFLFVALTLVPVLFTITA